ncbi:MAG: histidinol dehydrogenase, partial [Actinomycetales bacterium]
MLRVIDLRSTAFADPADLVGVDLPRAGATIDDAATVVQPILEAVRTDGAQAVQEWTQRLDGISAPSLRVPGEVIAESLAELDLSVRDALQTAIDRAEVVHQRQSRPDDVVEVIPGGRVTQRWIPVERVGLYVPGGQAVYPSSVVMNVVPAQVAGVASIAVTSPPQRDGAGWPHRTILAACALLGIDEVYAAGGAQAIGMLAYGVDLRSGVDRADGDVGLTAGRCAPVDMITGPGNLFVTAAKRAVRGLVGIDSEAGPTEIAILADETADAVHVAADLISQAEHDVLAAAVLVTTSTELAGRVQAEIARQLTRTKHVERITQALTGEQSAIVLVADLSAGLIVVNAYAAEHLEIQTRDARQVAMRVRNAGAIFVGPWSPVSLGDYCAGSNHVLPTRGCARHSSGLSVQTFLRGQQVIEYSHDALAASAQSVQVLAHAEDLPAHADAVRVRLE